LLGQYPMFFARLEVAFSEKQVLKVDENTEEENELLAGLRAPSTQVSCLMTQSLDTIHIKACERGYTRGTPRNCAPQLHYSQYEGLVGAVGIENTTGGNFKKLEGMLGSLRH